MIAGIVTHHIILLSWLLLGLNHSSLLLVRAFLLQVVLIAMAPGKFASAAKTLQRLLALQQVPIERAHHVTDIVSTIKMGPDNIMGISM